MVSKKFAAVVIIAVVALAVQNAFGWAITWDAIWDNFRLLKVSLPILAIAVFALLVGYGRKKRRAAPVAKRTDVRNLTPLRDDVAENVSERRFKWLEFKDRHWSALCKSLCRQMEVRPCTWGVGLWPDEETENVAKCCAELLGGTSGGMPINFIPADPMPMVCALVGSSTDLDDVGAMLSIEDEFCCELPYDGYETMTFADFAAYVKKNAGTLPPRDVKAERRGCLLALLKFGGLVAAFVALGVAANLVGKANGYPVGIGFGTLLVCWLASLVANWCVKNVRLLLAQLSYAIFCAIVLYFALPWDAIDNWAQGL